ncbi:hypothetical protein AAH994_14670 [Weeksellaceae bacterium A-14]
MALWQYTFHIIECKSIKDLSPDKLFIEDNFFNEEPYWIYSHKQKNLFSDIESILKKNISWSTNIDLYGTQESNCLEVFFDNENYITSVSFRIDFVNPYENLLRSFIEFCISKDLVMIDENLSIVTLNYEYIDSIIKMSSQKKVYDNLDSLKNN